EHEAGVEPACFGFKAQRGCRQPTARVLDQAAGIGPAWAAFRAQLGCQQPTPDKFGGPTRSRICPLMWRPVSGVEPYCARFGGLPAPGALAMANRHERYVRTGH